MTLVAFKGFGGVRLEAEVSGSPDNPAILLLHGGGQTRAVWHEAATALERAGRYVINLDLRGHGSSEWPKDARYDFDAFVEDLRAVLAQLGSRPVIVAATISGWIATVALGKDAATLAAGLVLVDLPTQYNAEMAGDMAAQMLALLLQKPVPDWDERFFDSFDATEVPERMRAAAPNIAVPVLFVRGALSELGSSDQAAELVGALPIADSVEVENASLLVGDERAVEPGDHDAPSNKMRSRRAIIRRTSRRHVIKHAAPTRPYITDPRDQRREASITGGSPPSVWRYIAWVPYATNRRAWKESPYQFGHVYLYPMAPRSWRASVQAAF